MRILVAEDSPLNFELVCDLLEGAGHEIVWAQDGEEAISRLRVPGYDLMLLDLHMPKRDGLSVLRELRTRTQNPGLKVVLVTADVMPGVRDELEAAGIDGYLTKPLDLALLLQTVERLGSEIDVPAGPHP